MKEYDYIIIGSGIAGLYDALLAQEVGSVLILTKGSIDECNTKYAQGGIAAMVGGRASGQAVDAVAELGLDLRDHQTQPLTETIVRHADVIYTMTRSHREAVVAQWPEAAERTWVLSLEGNEIADPIGGPLQRYRQCAAQIRSELGLRVEVLINYDSFLN